MSRRGPFLCPEGTAAVAAYTRALDEGLVASDDRVVLFNCGSGLKYPMPEAAQSLDVNQPIDWDAIAMHSPT